MHVGYAHYPQHITFPRITCRPRVHGCSDLNFQEGVPFSNSALNVKLTSSFSMTIYLHCRQYTLRNIQYKIDIDIYKPRNA